MTTARIERIRKRLGTYAIQIEHADGLYRHLYCYQPHNPMGEWERSFHVVTWPGYACIYGDWSDAYVIAREEDMLTGFLNRTRPDYTYWAEKLDGSYKNLRETTKETFETWLHEYLKTVYGEGSYLAAAIEKDILYYAPIGDGETRLYDYLDSYGFYGEVEYKDEDTGETAYYIARETDMFTDLSEETWDGWSEEWTRAAELLCWAACRYAAAPADGREHVGYVIPAERGPGGEDE